MSKTCEITGKCLSTGYKVSKANNKTKRLFRPNLQTKKLFLKELDAWVTLCICTQAMRTINKNGLFHTLKKALYKGTLAPRLAQLIAYHKKIAT